jgi:outer membrane protein assembly factor BamB
MWRTFPRAASTLVSTSCLLLVPLAHAQFGGGPPDFSTAGSDAQRSSWVRTDAKISRDALQKPGFQFLWKVKFNNEPKPASSLTPAVLLTRYIGYRGFRALGFVGGSADKVFALDTDLGRIEWQKSIASSTSICGMTSNVARGVSAAFPGAGGGRGFGGGRGGAAKSAVGEPGEGSVVLKEIAARMPAEQGGGRRGGAAGTPGAPGAPGFPGGRMRLPSYLHAISSDGMFHSMYVSNGEEPEPAIKFLPPNANAMGLIVVDNVAYAVTSAGCGSAPNAVWALDIASKQITSWQSPNGPIAGSQGVAFDPDGVLYTATESGSLFALEPKTLKVHDVYEAGIPLVSSPVVVQGAEVAMIAVAAKDGRVHLLVAPKLSGPAFKSEPVAAGATSLATWRDSAGYNYLLAATSNSLVALKTTEKAIETAWKRDMDSALAPLVVDGVVFTGNSGKANSPAVLSALDGTSGAPLWNSAKTITSFVRGGGISGGGSQIYLGTHDGTFYAFGFPIEH